VVKLLGGFGEEKMVFSSKLRKSKQSKVIVEMSLKLTVDGSPMRVGKR
jgi:hypothetical protein